MQKAKTGSLEIEALKSSVHTLQENESLGPAIIVGICALLFFLSVPFYGVLGSVFFAIVCTAITYYRAQFGMSTVLILGLFAIAHNSAGLAWVYAFVFFGMAILEMRFEAKLFDWRFFAYLIIGISGAFLNFAFAGVICFIALVLGSLQLGSQKSLVFGALFIYFVIILSSLGQIENNLGVLFSEQKNMPIFSIVQNEPVDSAVFVQALNSLSKMISWDGLTSVFAILGAIIARTVFLLLDGSLFLFLVVFVASAWAIGHLPSRFKDHQFAQTISATPAILCALAVVFVGSNYGVQQQIYDVPIYFFSIVYAVVAIGFAFILDVLKINISNEVEIISNQNQSTFGKFGEQKSTSTGVKLADIGGYEDVKNELMEAIAGPLKNKAMASAYGLKPASGVLLFGPPGTGKTLIMKALASELGLKFVSISCTDILSSWHGESEANVKEVFKTARASAPCILFFDEMEGLAKSREKSFNDDVGPRVLSVLLQEMDGFNKKTTKPVIIVGATNMPQQLDPAIMRPGRLDKIIYMHLPDFEARKKILQVHSAKLPMSTDFSVDLIAKRTEGYSGADLANIVKEASGLVAREARTKNVIIPISQKHFEAVLARIRPSTSSRQLAMYEQFKDEFERSVR